MQRLLSGDRRALARMVTLIENEIPTARRYLAEPDGGVEHSARVLNLCRTGRYQGRGYYVSLLAEARGHRALRRDPSVRADTEACLDPSPLQGVLRQARAPHRPSKILSQRDTSAATALLTKPVITVHVPPRPLVCLLSIMLPRLLLTPTSCAVVPSR